MLDVSSYTLVVFAHVLSAVALVGQSIKAPLVMRGVRHARSLDALRAWLDYARQSARWNPAISMVLLVSGLYLAWTAGWLTDGWVLVAVASWIVNSVLAVRVVEHTGKALGMAAGRAGEGAIPADVESLRASRGWVLASQAMVAGDVAVLYLMVAKPALTGSILAVALLTAVFAGRGLLKG